MEDNKREYSAIEIEVAKNLLEEGYGWIARDKDDDVYAYCTRPVKGGTVWSQGDDLLLLMAGSARGVIPLFESIRWEDEDPVRLRDIVPQILTDEEREWLRTVVRAFPGKLEKVMACDDPSNGRYITFVIDPPEGRIEGIEENVEYMVAALPVPKDWFKGMEKSKNYTPEELGI